MLLAGAAQWYKTAAGVVAYQAVERVEPSFEEISLHSGDNRIAAFVVVEDKFERVGVRRIWASPLRWARESRQGTRR